MWIVVDCFSPIFAGDLRFGLTSNGADCCWSLFFLNFFKFFSNFFLIWKKKIWDLDSLQMERTAAGHIFFNFFPTFSPNFFQLFLNSKKFQSYSNFSPNFFLTFSIYLKLSKVWCQGSFALLRCFGLCRLESKEAHKARFLLKLEEQCSGKSGSNTRGDKLFFWLRWSKPWWYYYDDIDVFVVVNIW